MFSTLFSTLNDWLLAVAHIEADSSVVFWGSAILCVMAVILWCVEVDTAYDGRETGSVLWMLTQLIAPILVMASVGIAYHSTLTAFCTIAAVGMVFILVDAAQELVRIALRRWMRR